LSRNDEELEHHRGAPLKRINSSYAIVLTGTPLENKLEELIFIVQFVDQHRPGPTWRLLHEHQVKDEAGRVTGYAGLAKSGRTLAPIMIRRRIVQCQQPATTSTPSPGADGSNNGKVTDAVCGAESRRTAARLRLGAHTAVRRLLRPYPQGAAHGTSIGGPDRPSATGTATLQCPPGSFRM
jgi:hypothetical protein